MSILKVAAILVLLTAIVEIKWYHLLLEVSSQIDVHHKCVLKTQQDRVYTLCVLHLRDQEALAPQEELVVTVVVTDSTEPAEWLKYRILKRKIKDANTNYRNNSKFYLQHCR